MSEVDVQKRIKGLQKKLGQISKLKEKASLTSEEQAKVATESTLLAEIAALEKGEVYKPPDPDLPTEEVKPPQAAPAVEAEPLADNSAAPEGDAPDEPAMDPAEAEKKIKALKKKLAQITKLKEKGAQLTAEETEKVSSETTLLNQVMDLEIGLLDPETKKSAKALQKKLEQIKKLKTKSQLTNQEREKASKGPEVKKELEALLASRPVFKEPAVVKKVEPAPNTTNGIHPKEQVSAKKAAQKAQPKPEPEPQECVYIPPDEDTISPIAEANMMEQAGVGQDQDDDDGFVEKKKKVKKPKAQPAQADITMENDNKTFEKPDLEQDDVAVVGAGAVEVLQGNDDYEDYQCNSTNWRDETVDVGEEYAAADITEHVEPEAPKPEKPEAPKPKVKAGPTPPAEEQTPDRRIKLLKKKLAQIDKLKSKDRSLLSEEEAEKIHNEASFLAEIEALQRGEPWPPAQPVAQQEAAHEAPPSVAEEVEVAAPAEEPHQEEPEETLTPEEASKRIKALNKKLAQIGKLKERSGPFSAEEKQKMAGEESIIAKIAQLKQIR